MTVGDSNRLRAATESIRAACTPDVRADIEDMLAQAEKPKWVHDATAALRTRYEPVHARPRGGMMPMALDEFAPSAGVQPIGVEESVILAMGTPVFMVQNSVVEVDSGRSEVKAWRKIVGENAGTLNRLMASIGRVDVRNLDDREFVGTAWVIDDGLVITNRHVAELFAQSSGVGFIFRAGFDARRPVGVNVDFLEEFGSDACDEVTIDGIVWIAPRPGPDIAFLRLTPGGGPVGRIALTLSASTLPSNLPVAVIGYPARDPNFSDARLMETIFGGVFDKKRFAVGNVLMSDANLLTHTCATLGGNSGSPVVDLATGQVVGLHARGIEFLQNEAVPAAVVNRCLKVARALRTNPATVSEDVNVAVEDGKPAPNGAVTFTVPLKVTVELDASGARLATGTQPIASTSAAVVAPASESLTVQAAVTRAQSMFASRSDIVTIKAGYRFVNGRITAEPAVVVAVKSKVDPEALAARGISLLPTSIGGVPIDIAVATPRDLLPEAFEEATKKNWHTDYQPRDDLPLERRKAKMAFSFHSSPDAGWTQLGPFLAKTKRSLTVGMYDFGARHIVDAVLSAVKGEAETMTMVMQSGEHKHAGEYTDQEVIDLIDHAKTDKFEFSWASIGKNGVFDSAYHIKVAVRDHVSMWLSSGNWQISNQPDIDPLTDDADARSALSKYNREWHAILDNAELAELFEKHLKRDLEDARAKLEAVQPPERFLRVPIPAVPEATKTPDDYEPPLKGDRVLDIQPVLTPDNYVETVLPLLRSAKEYIHLQNQSFTTEPHLVGPTYAPLLDTLLQKQADGVEVRIIFRAFPNARDVLTDAQSYGFKKADTLRKQANCHNKGIVVDGRAVLLGSQNWTTAGTKFNRDASLIVYDSEVAEFYEKLFQYDWNRIGPFTLDESVPAPTIVEPGEEATAQPGYELVSVSELLGR